MDANALRLVLVVLGIIVVGSIYLWDRSRREKKNLSNFDSRSSVEDHDILFSKSPSIDRFAVCEELSGLDEQIKQRAHKAPSFETGMVKIQSGDRPLSTATATAAVDSRDNEALDDRIIMLSVTARSQEGFRGEDIISAAEQAKLQFGDMGIFHHQVGSSDSSFSMASMVEPGSFDLSRIDRFSTPGLTFFMSAPGEQDDLSLFSDMLSSARSMANSLDGELRDQSHSTLTQQSIQHIREEIIEHRRRHQVLH